MLEDLEQRRLLATTVGFEHLPSGPVGSFGTGIYTDPTGYRFALQRSDATATSNSPLVMGSERGYPSKVLHPVNWGEQFLITRSDGQPFDLASFGYAAGKYGEAGDLFVMGSFANGTAILKQTAFGSSKTPATYNLDWTGLTSVRISYNGGVNGVYGALDNFVFGDDTSDGTAQTSGSLNGSGLVNGPVRLTFDDRSWHEAGQLLPRSDGAFYVIGRSGLKNDNLPRVPPATRQEPTSTTAFITKHNADGSIDRSFGQQGRRLLSELSFATTLIPSPAGGFFGFVGTTIRRYTDDLAIDTRFGGGDGMVSQSETNHFTPLANGGYALSSGGRIYTFDAEGDQSPSGSFNYVDLFASTTSVGPSSLGADALGRLYFAWTSDEPHPVYENQTSHFVNTARISPGLALDTSYGDGGVARYEDTTIQIDRSSVFDIFVGPDGRAVLELDEFDSDRNIALFDPDGQLLGVPRIYGSFDSFPFAEGDIAEVAFGNNGGIAVAYTGESYDTAVVGRYDGRGSYDFGVMRFDANGSWLGSNDINDSDNPARANDVFVDRSGNFVFGGFVEDVTIQESDGTPFITNIDHVAGLWRISNRYLETGGKVQLQAEDSTGRAAGSGSAGGHFWAQLFNDGTAGGNRALASNPNSGLNVGDTTAGPRNDYAINFTSTGTYYVWARMAGSSGSDDSVHVGLDGSPASFAGGVSLNSSQRNGQWHWVGTKGNGTTRVTVNVTSPGLHTFNLWMREDGAKVDEFILTKDANFSPSNPGGGNFQESNGRVDLEAESYTGVAAGTGSAGAHTWGKLGLENSPTGSAIIANPNSGLNTGDGLFGPRADYAINFTNTGLYYIWVHMGGATGSDDSLHVGFDGTARSLGGGVGLTASQRGGQYFWTSTGPGGARLTLNVTTPGLHTFNLWMREDGTKVNKFILSKNASFNPAT